MRIVTVLHSHGCGGAERHALLLMKQLRGAGHEPLFAGPLDSWLGEQIRREGIAAEHLPMHGFYDLASMLRLALICRRWRADIVHGHLTRGAFYAGIGGRLSRTPVVATAHSTNAGKHFGRADRIIAVSGAVASFMGQCGYDADRIRLVYHGVEDRYAEYAPRREALRAQLGLKDDQIGVCLVARMVRDKGHDILLEALSGMEGGKLQMFFLGEHDTDWGKKMQRLVAERGLGDRVHFLGHQENVYPTLAAMDVCVAPSRREALSLTLLEAGLMGCALLGADTGGIPEVIRDGVNGWLFPPEDPAALRAVLEKIERGVPDWRQAGLAARDDASRRFSLDAMLAGTVDVYRELARRP